MCLQSVITCLLWRFDSGGLFVSFNEIKLKKNLIPYLGYIDLHESKSAG